VRGVAHAFLCSHESLIVMVHINSPVNTSEISVGQLCGNSLYGVLQTGHTSGSLSPGKMTIFPSSKGPEVIHKAQGFHPVLQQVDAWDAKDDTCTSTGHQCKMRGKEKGSGKPIVSAALCKVFCYSWNRHMLVIAWTSLTARHRNDLLPNKQHVQTITGSEMEQIRNHWYLQAVKWNK